jgi:uncharacterized membrane protein YfcA
MFTLMGVDDRERMPLVVGTSLAAIVPTTISSFITHWRKGAVDRGALRQWAVPGVIGVLVGSALAGLVPSSLFKIVFSGVSALIGVRLLFGRERWRLADDLPPPWPMRLIGFAIGILSGFMGISGGMLTSMAMLTFGSPIHRAVATSAGLGMLIAIPGAIGYAVAGGQHPSGLPPLSIGYVSLPGAVLLAGAGAWLAPLGARIAHTITRRRLELAFAVYLLTMSARFVVALA